MAPTHPSSSAGVALMTFFAELAGQADDALDHRRSSSWSIIRRTNNTSIFRQAQTRG